MSLTEKVQEGYRIVTYKSCSVILFFIKANICIIHIAIDFLSACSKSFNVYDQINCQNNPINEVLLFYPFCKRGN